MAICFWILWAIDALVASVFVYFFMIGMGDGTVSSVNIVLWIMVLAILGAVLGGSLFLRAKKLGWVALGVLGLIAVPALGLALMFGMMMIFNPRWN
jgi:hypothetical protein